MTITQLKENLIQLEQKGLGDKRAIIQVGDSYGNTCEADFITEGRDKDNTALSDICNHESLLGFMFQLSCKDNYYGENTRVNIRHIKK
tara:strand:- start:777 stop:1040 length:264 start_codon:yes stop_codon:yes gene_type:complete